MSGHNKWSKVKHKKAATDAKRSAIFGKLSKLISVESKKANGDRNAPGLRKAIETARGISMPNDNIDRAVAKGSSSDMKPMEEVVYETYGPGGVAVIATGLTDSRNRTAGEIKHLLSLEGYQLAAPGSASWAFTHSIENGYVPNMTVPINEADGEKLSVLIEKLEDHDDIQDVYTNAE